MAAHVDHELHVGVAVERRHALGTGLVVHDSICKAEKGMKKVFEIE